MLGVGVGPPVTIGTGVKVGEGLGIIGVTVGFGVAVGVTDRIGPAVGEIPSLQSPEYQAI